MRALLRALFRPTRYHHRSEGPVVIDPEVHETVIVWGTAPERKDS